MEVVSKGSVPLRLGEKNKKIRKSKFCSLFGLNVFFNVLTLIGKKYQCLKLNTYVHVVTLFFQSGGIVFTLKLH